jgi:transcriptional regulator with XRE-family HTH domain
LNQSVAVAFGKVLRKVRQDAGLSQEQLALAATLQRKHISALELGDKQPTITTVFKLSGALQIAPRSLVELVEVELKRP